MTSSERKPKLIVILGPTGSGKTKCAIELAKQFDGEVVSSDSRQVYRGLDIGTDKVTKEEMQGVPHHCLDIASPKRSFSAAQWKKHAEKAIKGIVRRGKVPIVAGGTGYYIDVLVGTIPLPEVKPNATLRKKLEKLSNEELLAKLQKVDPNRAETIEPDHQRRLIRAIEIAEALGSVPQPTPLELPYEILYIGLTVDEETFDAKLKKRMSEWFKDGFVAEVETLRKQGLSDKRIQELGFEYRAVDAYILGEITEDEMHDQIMRGLKKYVKRQKRWFARNPDIEWFNSREIQKIKNVTQKFLKP